MKANSVSPYCVAAKSPKPAPLSAVQGVATTHSQSPLSNRNFQTSADSKPKRILVATQMAHFGFLQGVSRFAKERHWQLITDMLHTGTLPQRWDGDGIIAFVPYQSDITAYVAGADLPSVTVSMTDGCSAVPRVQSDNAAIGQLAGQHLAALGCKSFAWAPFIDDVQNWERYKGFQKELRRRGFDCELLPTAHHKIGSVWYDDWSDWRHAVAEQLEKLPKPIGLFAFNDCLAGELAALALEVGLPVPDALSIIGVGNELVECESAPITLTSIDPDLPEMAYQAACLLDDMLAGKPVARDTFEVKPKGVVVRESAAAADNQENARIGQAIAFISQSFADPNLNVALVADSLGISRRQLERDFRADMGCTIREYIEQARMKAAARLLIHQPEANIDSIASQVGISAPGNFFRIFRKRFGVTPSVYRAR